MPIVLLLVSCAGNPIPRAVNPTPARQQQALRLAIDWSDPNHLIGLTADSPIVLDFLYLIHNIYAKYPDLENIPVYDFEAPSFRASKQLDTQKFQTILKRLEICTHDIKETTTQRRGVKASKEIMREWNFYLSAIQSPGESCQFFVRVFNELAIIQISLLEFTHKKLPVRNIILHSSLAQDMQAVTKKIGHDLVWGKLLDGLKAEELPRQHGNYESLIEIKPNSNPVSLIFKENNTIEESNLIQTVFLHHEILATKGVDGHWDIKRGLTKKEIKATSNQ